MIRQKGWHRGRRVLFQHASEARMNRSENCVNRRQNTIRQFDSIAAWRRRYRFFPVSLDCRRGDGCKLCRSFHFGNLVLPKRNAMPTTSDGAGLPPPGYARDCRGESAGTLGAAFKAAGQLKRFFTQVKQDSCSRGN
jgi:hypothetical protein